MRDERLEPAGGLVRDGFGGAGAASARMEQVCTKGTRYCRGAYVRDPSVNRLACPFTRPLIALFPGPSVTYHHFPRCHRLLCATLRVELPTQLRRARLGSFGFFGVAIEGEDREPPARLARPAWVRLVFWTAD